MVALAASMIVIGLVAVGIVVARRDEIGLYGLIEIVVAAASFAAATVIILRLRSG
jgi:hypothetical protein